MRGPIEKAPTRKFLEVDSNVKKLLEQSFRYSSQLVHATISILTCLHVCLETQTPQSDRPTPRTLARGPTVQHLLGGTWDSMVGETIVALLRGLDPTSMVLR